MQQYEHKTDLSPCTVPTYTAISRVVECVNAFTFGITVNRAYSQYFENETKVMSIRATHRIPKLPYLYTPSTHHMHVPSSEFIYRRMGD